LIAQQASAAREKDRQKPKDDGIAQPAGAEKPTAATPVKIPNDKAASNSSASENFLGFRVAKAKEAKTARRAANVDSIDPKRRSFPTRAAGWRYQR